MQYFLKDNESNFDKVFENNKVLKGYTKFTGKKIYFILGLILLIIFIGTLAITLGPMKLSFIEVYTTVLSKIMPDIFSASSELAKTVIWNVRLPRLLMGFITGFGLSIAGAVMQPVLKNPLASPFTLGISSGAGFGAALAIICGKSSVHCSFFDNKRLGS